MRLILTYFKLILRRNGKKNLYASAQLSLCIIMVTLFPVIKSNIRLLPAGAYLNHYLCSLQVILLVLCLLGLLKFLWRSLQSAMSEFGIMMSLGACRKDVRRFVFLQTSISGLITLSFGLLAGSMLSILILDLVIICTGSDLDFPIDTRAAVLLAGAVLFAIVLMGIRFYRKIIRNTTAALLSENISPAIITDVLGKDKANDRY